MYLYIICFQMFMELSMTVFFKNNIMFVVKYMNMRHENEIHFYNSEHLNSIKN